MPVISPDDRRKTIEKLVEVARRIGKVYDFKEYISAASVTFQASGTPPPRIHNSTCCWNLCYPS
jgi:hypothetical protein